MNKGVRGFEQIEVRFTQIVLALECNLWYTIGTIEKGDHHEQPLFRTQWRSWAIPADEV